MPTSSSADLSYTQIISLITFLTSTAYSSSGLAYGLPPAQSIEADIGLSYYFR